MATKTLRYTLDDINDIIFHGFDYSLPDETLKFISELTLQVGSPDYVKTPVFQKRENPMKDEIIPKENFKKKKNNKSMEVLNDADWEAIRTFQVTKIEDKEGVDAKIDLIRTYLNKLTDKNYIDIRNKITEIIQNINSEEMVKISSIIFDIASTNRFYSKIYADLYSDLSTNYEIMKSTFEENLNKFAELFTNIEYVDPNVDYNKFCEINKINEKRKSLCSFYLNLMTNGIIRRERIMLITRNLLSQIYEFILIDNKKNEVDELTENVSLLYKKELYDNSECKYPKIDDNTVPEIITKIAKSKVKDYKSLTNKSLFKFMDMVDM
jgi:hypothetical protein